jgi:hypothetical protein
MNESPCKPAHEEWEDPYPKEKSRGWIRRSFLLLAFYVLSVGPLSRLETNGRSSLSTIQFIYKPLVALGNKSATAKNILTWWMKLWLPKQDEAHGGPPVMTR